MGGKHRGKIFLWTRATAEKNVWERLVGPSLVGQQLSAEVGAGSHGSRVHLALNGEDGGAVRGADWDL